RRRRRVRHRRPLPRRARVRGGGAGGGIPRGYGGEPVRETRGVGAVGRAAGGCDRVVRVLGRPQAGAGLLRAPRRRDRVRTARGGVRRGSGRQRRRAGGRGGPRRGVAAPWSLGPAPGRQRGPRGADRLTRRAAGGAPRVVAWLVAASSGLFGSGRKAGPEIARLARRTPVRRAVPDCGSCDRPDAGAAGLHDEDVGLTGSARLRKDDPLAVGRERIREDRRALLEVRERVQPAPVGVHDVDLGLLTSVLVRSEENQSSVRRPIRAVTGTERPGRDLPLTPPVSARNE